MKLILSAIGFFILGVFTFFMLNTGINESPEEEDEPELFL